MCMVMLDDTVSLDGNANTRTKSNKKILDSSNDGNTKQMHIINEMIADKFQLFLHYLQSPIKFQLL